VLILMIVLLFQRYALILTKDILHTIVITGLVDSVRVLAQVV
jgi:hypothetical protein